ncbi:hypothetical protein Tco_0374499 [Tanacetum coccineum]
MFSKPNATLTLGMFKLDIEPISPRLKNNRDAHEVYIEKTVEYADTLRGFVERARTYKKLVAVTPIKKDKRVRFAEPVTSSSNIPKQTNSLKTKDSNKPLLTSTGVKPTTSASGSKPLGNTNNNMITRPPRSNQKNKVEDRPSKVKFSLNKMNFISDPINNALVKHSVRNAKFESMCAICNKFLFDANHDMCLVDFVNDVNVFHLLLLLSMIGCPDCSLVYGLRMFKTYDREPFSAHKLSCALGKSKKSSHQPKAEDTDQEKLYLLHIDLCGLIRVESINGKSISWDDWDTLFQSLFNEYFNPPTIVVSTVPVAAAPRVVEIANSPVSTSIDQDAPSSKSPKTPLFHDDHLHEFFHEDLTSQGSSSNVRPSYTPVELSGRWTKDHPIENVIGDPSRLVSTRKQLKTDAMWCYFDAFLTSVESKNFKQAMTKPSWIDAMRE